jgi:hypothetical protein
MLDRSHHYPSDFLAGNAGFRGVLTMTGPASVVGGAAISREAAS